MTGHWFPQSHFTGHGLSQEYAMLDAHNLTSDDTRTRDASDAQALSLEGGKVSAQRFSEKSCPPYKSRQRKARHAPF